MKEKFTTKIMVRETRVTHSGQTRTGGTFTLYQVIATKPSGEAIDMNLRSFEDLPKNVVLEVEAELYRSEQYGDSYTLKRLGGGTASQLQDIEKRVKRIEDFLSGRGEFRGTAAPEAQAAPPAQPPPPPPPAPLPESPAGDSDIPF
jgi:hypothetical protein